MKIGDELFLLKEGEMKKFDNHCTGPYKVLDVLGKGNQL